jgi:FAD synthase
LTHTQKKVVSGKDNFELLMHIDKKLELLDFMGVDITFVVPFDSGFSSTSAPEFLK